MSTLIALPSGEGTAAGLLEGLVMVGKALGGGVGLPLTSSAFAGFRAGVAFISSVDFSTVRVGGVSQETTSAPIARTDTKTDMYNLCFISSL